MRIGRKYIWIKYLLIVIISIIHTHINTLSQATGDPKEDFLYGEYYLIQGSYQKALPFYLSALEANPDNSNINYRVGLCYMRIIGSRVSATPYLEKAVKLVDEHYVEGRYKDPSAPIEAWLLLGDTYHRENELTKASKAYHEYKSLIDDSDKELQELIMQKIEGLGISYEFQREEGKIKMINLGSVINTRFSDYNPVLSGDQKTMIFTQYWETFDRILVTNLTEEGWSSPKDISDEIGTDGLCYTSALSFDGSELYLVCHDKGQFDIYVSYLESGSWSKMVQVKGKINTRFRESSVSISADGRELLFASDRSGGEGGFDLYKATRDGDVWDNVINLGQVINTEKNEEAPNISSDGTTLFFSSDGHETIGNMDIVYSELNAEGKWSRPVNIGTPVNTTSDDLFYIHFKKTKTGYLSRDLPEGYGKNDIYIISDAIKSLGDGNPIIDFTNGVALLDFFMGKYVDPPPRSTTKLANSTTGSNSDLSAIESIEVTDEYQTDSYADANVLTPASDTYISAAQNASSDNLAVEPSPQSGAYIEASNLGSSSGNLNEEYVEEFKNYSEKLPESDILEDVAYYSSDDYLTDSVPTYTIQIYALMNPVDRNKLKLDPVAVSAGYDGLHRYTYGEFVGYSKALEYLDSVRRLGYPDAFIRNISTIQNYLK